MTQSAVIRQLEIIGEAVKRISKELTESEPAVPYRQIAETRERLIHANFNLDRDAVWIVAPSPAVHSLIGKYLSPWRT